MKPRQFNNVRSIFIAMTLGPAICTPNLQAADRTWSGAGGDNLWSTATNWDVLPVVDDVLIFDGTVQTTNFNDFAEPTQFGGLIFGTFAGAFTATGNTLQMEGNVTNASANDQNFAAINFYVQTASRTFDTGAKMLTIGDLFGTGNPVKIHTKIGSGILHLTADGTPVSIGNGTGAQSGDYTRFDVNEGTLLLDANSTQNRQTIESVTINSGGTVKFGEGSTNSTTAYSGFLFGFTTLNTGGTLDLNGHTLKDGRMQTLNGSGGVITNTNALDASITIASRSTATETFAGIIEDGTAGGKTGVEIAYGGANPGRVNVFTGASTYTGPTQINDGTLVINGNQTAANGLVTVLNRANARFGGAGTIGGSVISGGRFSPGNITATATELPGMMTVLGSLTFDPNASFTSLTTGAVVTLPARQQDYNFDVAGWGAGLTAGTDYDTVVAGSMVINSTNAEPLSVNVAFSGAGITNFKETAQSFILATTTSGITGLIDGDAGTRNWKVTSSGVPVSGTWSVVTSGNNLVLNYTPGAPTADVVWDGGGTDNNASTAANWVGDVGPVPGQSIGFNGSTRTSPNNNLGGTTSVVVSSDVTLASVFLDVATVEGIEVGQSITGSINIPDGTTVVSVSAEFNEVEMSQSATGFDTGINLTFASSVTAQVDGIVFLNGAAPFTLLGNPLKLGDADEVPLRVTNDSPNLQTIALNLEIASNSNRFWAGNGDILHTGKLFAASAKTITGIGAFTTTLAGTADNSFLNVDSLAGTLVLAKTNSSEDPVVHAAANVVLGAASLGTVKLAGSGGDQIGGNVTINGGSLDLNGRNESVPNIIAAVGSTGVILNNMAATTSTLTVSNGSGSFYGAFGSGAGTLAMRFDSATNTQITLLGASSYTGGTTINGSFVRIQGTSPIGTGPVTFLGVDTVKSTLFVPSNNANYPSGVVSNNLFVAAGNRGKIRWGRAITASGTLTGDGTLVVTHENRNGQGTTVTGDWSAFTGTVISKPGDSATTTTNSTHLTLANNSGLPGAVLTLRTENAVNDGDDPVPDIDGNAATNGQLRYGGSANGVMPIGDLNTYGDEGVGALSMFNNVAGTATFQVGSLGLSSTFGALIQDGNATNITAITKVGVGTWTLTNAASSYTGQTSVVKGTLSIVHNLANAAPVRVASGAVLNLAIGNDVVDSLWLDGVQVDAGTYGPIGSDATHDSNHFTGTGYLNVTHGAVPGYSSWATTHAGGQSPGQDYDGDGVSNGIEYFLGQTGSTFTANPGLVSGKVTWTNGGNIPSAAYGTQFVVQTSANLAAWTNVLAGDTNLANISGSVSYTPPVGAGKVFVRLVVTPN